jgi:hypothetical protein
MLARRALRDGTLPANLVLAFGLAVACGQAVPRTPELERRPPQRAAAEFSIPEASVGTNAGDSGAAAAQPCGPSSCDYARDTCCESEPQRLKSGCVSKTAMPDPGAGQKGHKCYGALANDWIGIECLSSADCPEGVRCCATEGDPGLNHCANECEAHEACVPTGPRTCHAGSTCSPSAASRSGGVCLVESPGVQCGKQRCGGKTPACHYDRKTRRADCISVPADGALPEDVPLNEGSALLHCASPSDCASERCCTSGPLPITVCSGMCTSGIDVCSSLADCPEFLGPPIACKADPDGPPFLKTCRYR